MTAPRFIHAEKGLKNALAILRRYSCAAVRNANFDTARLFAHGEMYAAVRTVIAYRIFAEIKEQAVNQGVTADQHCIALVDKFNVLFFRERREIGAKFFHQGSQFYPVLTGNGAKLAQFQESLTHFRHALGLLSEQAKKVRGFGIRIRVLDGKELKLCLHEGKRCSEFVGGIAGKLFLGAKTLVESVQHAVKGFAGAAKLCRDICGEFHVLIGEIVRFYFFEPRCKLTEGAQRLSAHKIGERRT